MALDSESGAMTLPPVRVAFIPGPMTDLLTEVEHGLRSELLQRGCTVVDEPDSQTDLVITSAPFGTATSWRHAVLLNLRRNYQIQHSPVVYTLVQALPAEFEGWIKRFEIALERSEPNPDDYRIDGLAENAYRVLHEQGRRGGPILALERAVQAQTKSVRVILVVGEDTLDVAYHFDLVGAHPKSTGDHPDDIYRDIVLRMIATIATEEVAEHQVDGAPVPKLVWRKLRTPDHMSGASAELNERGFFTEPVIIADLVNVPAVSDAVANHYSEGCFATWEPELDALVATVTGSIRPVHKGHVSRDDLAVIVAVRPGGMGALYHPIEGLPPTPPSSEAVELISMDQALPKITLSDRWNVEERVPVLRSKLHGHRGISAYNPDRVEFVPLDLPYYDYLVSCASDAQAMGVREAFSRSEALQNPDDPRQVVFTVLPGHGVMIVEKWIPDTDPFQVIWESMDTGDLDVTSVIPQGRLGFRRAGKGRRVLETMGPA